MTFIKKKELLKKPQKKPTDFKQRLSRSLLGSSGNLNQTSTKSK